MIESVTPTVWQQGWVPNKTPFTTATRIHLFLFCKVTSSDITKDGISCKNKEGPESPLKKFPPQKLLICNDLKLKMCVNCPVMKFTNILLQMMTETQLVSELLVFETLQKVVAEEQKRAYTRTMLLRKLVRVLRIRFCLLWRSDTNHSRMVQLSTQQRVH